MTDLIEAYDLAFDADSTRKGECYRLAGQYVLDSDPNDMLTLVHGQAAFMPSNLPQVPFEHAWVLFPDDSVWEPISQMHLTAKEWEAIAKVEYWTHEMAKQDWPTPPAKHYTREQTIARIVTERHWGSWWGPEPEGVTP